MPSLTQDARQSEVRWVYQPQRGQQTRTPPIPPPPPEAGPRNYGDHLFVYTDYTEFNNRSGWMNTFIEQLRNHNAYTIGLQQEWGQPTNIHTVVKWRRCGECRTLAPRRHCTKVRGGKHVCQSCIGSKYMLVGTRLQRKPDTESAVTSCYDCGRVRPVSELKIISIREPEDSPVRRIGICGDCRGYRSEAGGLRSAIIPYNADPMHRITSGFVGDPPDGLYLGVELELEVRAGNRHLCANEVYEMWGGRAAMKHDGSLASGFEIVTAPMSLDAQRESWSKFFEERAPRLTHYRLGAWEMQTCGLHVHISRGPMSDLQIGKMVAFVHSPSNKHLIRKLAGRNNKRYGSYDEFKSHNEIMRVPIGAHSNDRYTAVNISNRQTVELRVFKGTMNRLRVLADIEFVHALAKWCEPCNSSIQDSYNGAKFIAWLNDSYHLRKYPNLCQFLRRQDFSNE